MGDLGRRLAYLDGRLAAGALTPEEWRMAREHAVRTLAPSARSRAVSLTLVAGAATLGAVAMAAIVSLAAKPRRAGDS